MKFRYYWPIGVVFLSVASAFAMQNPPCVNAKAADTHQIKHTSDQSRLVGQAAKLAKPVHGIPRAHSAPASSTGVLPSDVQHCSVVSLEHIVLSGCLRVIGEGSFACVESWGDKAVKLFKRKVIFDYRKYSEANSEIQMMANIPKHPNLVELIQVVQARGCERFPMNVGFVMPLYGPTLLSVIENRDVQYTLRDVQSWALQIVSALQHLHRRCDVVHCDIKANNIVFKEKNGPYLCPVVIDLGLARYKQNGRIIARQCGGTPPYVSPELYIPCNPDKTEKIDIYAFGMVLWEMLMREKVFEQEFQESILLKNKGSLIRAIVQEGKRPDLSHIERFYPEFVPVLQACWQQESRLRPTAEQLIQMLKDAVREENALVKVESAPQEQAGASGQ